LSPNWAARRRKRSATGKKVDLPGIDIVSLARGYGCDGARLDDIAAIKKAVTEAWGEQRPTVLEIPISAQAPPLI
jgi:benzoylformate decarboxylase